MNNETLLKYNSQNTQKIVGQVEMVKIKVADLRSDKLQFFGTPIQIPEVDTNELNAKIEQNGYSDEE
tara:strand:+ start:61 stop:261 length:201 start_codon:yes stop_codon:yes gene_type:complete